MDEPDPLISFRGCQNRVFWLVIRMLFLLWRRQLGKSFTLASKGLSRMILRKNHLCVFGSASILLGSEFIRKEAEVWQKVMEKFRQIAKDKNLLLTTNADGLDFDAVCDLFEHQKLETRIYHDRTSYSRSRVVAPNPATAVGWTGDVFLDEVGRIPGLKDILEAVMPIMESNPEFIMWMATTPPPDDKHYSFELFQPPSAMDFPVNPLGNFYDAPAGVLVHRFDAWDGEAAGIHLHHPKTGEPITPEEHRALAFDKAGWDRNYALKFLAGGTAAVSTTAILRAMALGKPDCLGVNITEAVIA
ncbi:hypothetical protein [Geminisphaera colitermitum]|uniref:hypothetical protein n=1 Tax=Geminisphaera colitermitum TaxID=1148786 RepID=UPI000158C72A|nr:hypothetical protein [Geminisphaera colitermitum]